MSQKKLAILHIVNHHGGSSNYTTLMGEADFSPRDPSPPAQPGTVNVTLGGAMVGGIILSVMAMCYCCHKGARKHATEVLPPQQCRWRYSTSALPLHIYTVEGHQFCESEDLVLSDIGGRSSSPPPEYDTVVVMPNSKEEGEDLGQLPPKHFGLETDSTGLPSYDTALRLGASVRHL